MSIPSFSHVSPQGWHKTHQIQKSSSALLSQDLLAEVLTAVEFSMVPSSPVSEIYEEALYDNPAFGTVIHSD